MTPRAISLLAMIAMAAGGCGAKQRAAKTEGSQTAAATSAGSENQAESVHLAADRKPSGQKWQTSERLLTLDALATELAVDVSDKREQLETLERRQSERSSQSEPDFPDEDLRKNWERLQDDLKSAEMEQAAIEAKIANLHGELDRLRVMTRSYWRETIELARRSYAEAVQVLDEVKEQLAQARKDEKQRQLEQRGK